MLFRSSTHRPTVREAFIRLMRDFGIDTVFGNPGSTELPMFRQFPQDMQYVLGLQESTVVGMADGYAQATRGAAMVNLHSAVGVGHAMGNIFTAYKNQTPLIITAGQQARSILPFDPYLFASQATDLPRPYVKWACEPARAAGVSRGCGRRCGGGTTCRGGRPWSYPGGGALPCASCTAGTSAPGRGACCASAHRARG